LSSCGKFLFFFFPPPFFCHFPSGDIAKIPIPSFPFLVDRVGGGPLVVDVLMQMFYVTASSLQHPIFSKAPGMIMVPLLTGFFLWQYLR